MSLKLERVERGDGRALEPLSELLIDSVGRGASVGFMAPMPIEEARAYWRGVLARLGPAQRLWLLFEDGLLQGTAQLALCEKPNGRHRAEVQKLLVHSRARGRGHASVLLKALEQAAQAEGLSLLVLDTETGSKAEQVYRHLGWQHAGEIPHYALTPMGQPHPTSLYYKLI